MNRNHAEIVERQSVVASSKQVRLRMQRYSRGNFVPRKLNRNLPCLSSSSSPENSASASSLPQPLDLPAPRPLSWLEKKTSRSIQPPPSTSMPSVQSSSSSLVQPVRPSPQPSSSGVRSQIPPAWSAKASSTKLLRS